VGAGVIAAVLVMFGITDLAAGAGADPGIPARK
jgi:hypothetical protein